MPYCRSDIFRLRPAIGLALVVAALVVVSGLWTPARAAGAVYYVSPTGSNSNSGTSSSAPFKTLQKALDVAQPGTTINLLAGTYREAVTTKVAGTAAAPIRITGPENGKAIGGRYKAVLYGVGGRVFSINHSYYTLDGFTIDGQEKIARTEYPTSPSLSQIWTFKESVQTKAANSKLIYVGAATTSADIVGTTISNMFLSGSGGECVRFRNRAANSLVVDSVIQWCGMLGQGDGDDQYKYHNAEGVYVGTSPKSTDQPMAGNDSSNNIVVRGSTINTFGSECFEVKENAHHNRIEDSECGYNDEPKSFQGSNIELRGDHNTVLRTELYQSRSWNLKLASDSAGYDRGGNTAQRSTFTGATGAAIVNRQTGSGPFCGNTFSGTVSEGNSIGNPTGACADTHGAHQAHRPGRQGELRDGRRAHLDGRHRRRRRDLIPGAAQRDPGRHEFDDVVHRLHSAGRHHLQLHGRRPRRRRERVARFGRGVGHDPGGYSDDAPDDPAPDDPARPTTPPPTTPPPTAQTIVVEAESGVLVAPMAVGTDTKAQGQRFVSQVSGSAAGKVTFTVNVPVAGRYALAGRVIAPNGSSDSFLYKIDAGATTTWNLGTRSSWTWVTGPTLTLAAGQHTIVISKRENGARLDAIRLTPVP